MLFFKLTVVVFVYFYVSETAGYNFFITLIFMQY